MTFATPLALVALAVPAVLALLVFRDERRRRSAIARYEADGGAGPLAVGRSATRRRVKAAMLVAAAVFAVLAAARPQWGTEPQPVARRGADIAVVLDVSSSMAAQDVQPDRLARARAEAAAIVESLRGDRVGFAIFAGTAFQRFPLTTDLALAAQLIGEQPPSPTEVDAGTALDAGLRAGLDLLASTDDRAKAILIVSDGEDLTGEAILAIDEARNRGIRIFAVGIGGDGATIPAVLPGTDQVIDKIDPATGEPVITRLVPESLERAALDTGGAYVAITPAEGSAAGLIAPISSLEEALLDHREEERPVERFQLFLAVAILLLVVEVLVSEAAGRRSRRVARAIRTAPAAAGLLFVACAGGVALVNDQANTLFDRGRYRDALAKYREVQAERPDLLEVHYNIGTSLYRLADYDRASIELQRVLQSPDPALAARAYYTLGNSYVRLGRLDDAVRAYRSSLKLEPDDEDAKFNLELIQRRLDSLTPSATPSASTTPGPGTETPPPTGTGTATPEPGESGTPGSTTATPDGSGTPNPSATGSPGPGTPDPNQTGTPGPGTPDPSQTGTPGPGETGTPSSTASPNGTGTADDPGREVGAPEQPQGSVESGPDPQATDEQLRELLRALQDPELAPEDALRILDAYRRAQAAREAERQRGPTARGENDW